MSRSEKPAFVPEISAGLSSARAVVIAHSSTATTPTAFITSRISFSSSQTLPCQSWTIHAEFYQPTVIDFGDVDRPSIRPAEAEIARMKAQNVDLFQYLPFGRKFHDGAFAMSRDVE